MALSLTMPLLLRIESLYLSVLSEIPKISINSCLVFGLERVSSITVKAKSSTGHTNPPLISYNKNLIYKKPILTAI